MWHWLRDRDWRFIGLIAAVAGLWAASAVLSWHLWGMFIRHHAGNCL